MFPEDVAVAIGGPGTREYAVIEMHYNNPLLQSGIIIIIMCLNSTACMHT